MFNSSLYVRAESPDDPEAGGAQNQENEVDHLRANHVGNSVQGFGSSREVN